MMKVFLGADHRGFELKEKIKLRLQENGYMVVDMGAHEKQSDDDYVDYAKVVVEGMSLRKDRAVLLCGSGHGMEMTANRYAKARAILGFNKQVTKQGREHEDANILVLAAEWVKETEAEELVKVFLETKFSNKERYKRRIMKMGTIKGRPKADQHRAD